MQQVGCECVFSSEWDKDAATSYQAYFGDTPHGDITKIESISIPNHDILAAGFPCQSFSIIGNKKGFNDTRGTLFFDIERILKYKAPQAFILENVKNLISHDGKKTFKTILDNLSSLGYFVHWKVLNALDFNLPQKRERVVIVGFKNKNNNFTWPEPQTRTKTLTDILDPESQIPIKHFASTKIIVSVANRLKNKELPPKPWISHENKSKNISPLPYSCALRARASYNYLLVNGVRRLTSRESLRLQGFPDNFPIVVSDTAIRKQTGNSVSVPMMTAVAKQMITALGLN